MTRAQVASDKRCLYIWGSQVFQKGSRNSPHHGHPCGTDITSVIPGNHVGNQSRYLLPNYVANVCANPTPTQKPQPTNTPVPTPIPTSTPWPTSTPIPTRLPTRVPTSTPIPTRVPTSTPWPTSTPIPTRVPTRVPTSTPRPTSTPVPTRLPTRVPTSTPTPKPKPTNTPIPTQKPLGGKMPPPIFGSVNNPTPTLTPKPTTLATPTLSLTPTGNPTKMVQLATPTIATTTLQPTLSSAAGVSLSLAFVIPGIGLNRGNVSPRNPNRPLTISLYSSDQNPLDLMIKPIYTTQSQIAFDANSASPTYGKFVNNALVTVPDGQYQLVLETDHALRLLVKDTETSSAGAVLTLKKAASITVPPQTFIVGDTTGDDNVMNISDYNVLVSCFGGKRDSSDCLDKQAADLNDDGEVSGIDYNLMLLSFKKLLSLGFPAPQLVINPTPTIAVEPTRTPTPTLTNTPTPVPTNTPVPPSPTAVSHPKRTPTMTSVQTQSLQKVRPTPSAMPTKPSSLSVMIAGITDMTLLSRVLIILGFLVLVGTVLAGILRSKVVKQIAQKSQEQVQNNPKS